MANGGVIQDIKDLLSIGKGLSITFKYMFKPKVTVQYPEQKRPVFARYRGGTSCTDMKTAWSAA